MNSVPYYTDDYINIENLTNRLYCLLNLCLQRYLLIYKIKCYINTYIDHKEDRALNNKTLNL